MRFSIGQDALGRWAWMLFDVDGTLLSSEDGYQDAARAMEDALNHMELRERAAVRRRAGR